MSASVSAAVHLIPVDSADVTILDDNYCDLLLAGSEIAQRPPIQWDSFTAPALRAEHGYALLLTVHRNSNGAGGGMESASILYDAGLGRDTVQYNMDVLGLSVGDLRAVALSHGHADHHGGLEGIFRRIGRRGMPLVLHPDVWRERKIVFPTGVEMHLPPPSHNDLDREGVEIIEERGPSLLLDGTVLITGQVERVTDFEPGFPIQQARTAEGAWEPDVWVWDDQAVVCHVKGKGLLVLTSCSHSGVINVMLHARHITGVEQVYGLVGGMHLTGALMEPFIPRTLTELATIAPSVVVPGHCTGWKATHELSRQMPGAYIQSSVGTRLHFA
jgi:7,8-dihydropterin-6-yl-methyl-4-(beta-D-ribofuranosyl)aminobenzene 5'-phosphate synthase